MTESRKFIETYVKNTKYAEDNTLLPSTKEGFKREAAAAKKGFIARYLATKGKKKKNWLTGKMVFTGDSKKQAEKSFERQVEAEKTLRKEDDDYENCTYTNAKDCIDSNDIRFNKGEANRCYWNPVVKRIAVGVKPNEVKIDLPANTCQKVRRTDNEQINFGENPHPRKMGYFKPIDIFTPKQLRNPQISTDHLRLEKQQQQHLIDKAAEDGEEALKMIKEYDAKRKAVARLVSQEPESESESKTPTTAGAAGGGRKTRKKRGRGNEPTISSREWVVENTQASINRFVNSNLPERGDGFNTMIRRMTSDEMDGGFWIIEWSLTRPRDDNLNHFHLAHDDEDNEGSDLIRFVDGPDAPAGRRKRRKRKTKRKKRKKKKTTRKRRKRKKRKKKTRRRR